MLDIKLIRENHHPFEKAMKDKGFDPSVVKDLMEKDAYLDQLRQEVEKLRATINEGSKKIGQLKDEKERQQAIEEMAKVKKDLKGKELALAGITEQFDALMLRIANPPLSQVPIGKTDADNVEVRTWGKQPKFSFEPKSHVELGESLDIIDIPRGVKISGSRFYFLKNEGALLELAILNYTLQKLVQKGFTPFIPPVLVQYTAMMATGYFPGGEEQAYAVGVKKTSAGPIEDDHLHLVGTSEVSVASYHFDEMLNESDLPKLYAGISPCFRREAGTYGKDTQGLYRIHQFQKVEQVVICKNDVEESKKLHQMILSNAEEVLQDLLLPYRVVDVCTGDMGMGQVYKNDIETWMPSRKSYGETHSCSTFHEFQARRLKLRYKTASGEKKFCHTLNNTCIASPRILIPLLELYQKKDGSVEIPKVLRPFMMGKEIIEPKFI